MAQLALRKGIKPGTERGTPKLSKLLQEASIRALTDPDWFCDKVLHIPNDPWQSEMMNAVADLDRIRLGIPTIYNHDGLSRFSVCAFHGPGKTHWLAKLMHWHNFTRKGRIPCTGPKEKTLRTRLWPEFRKILRNSEEVYRRLIKVDSTTITWVSNVDWCALIETAGQPENLAGYHDDNLMFLIEEASGVSDEMFQVIEGALTEQNAIMVMISNPTKTTGEFYNSHKKRGVMELYYRKQIRHEESNRVDPKWVANMIRKYGRDSPVVRVRVFGEFVTSSANQLITMQWLENARNGESLHDGSYRRVRVSVDVADGGVDETVFTVGYHYDSGVDIVKIERRSFDQSTAVADASEVAERLFLAYGGQKNGGLAGDDFVIDGVGVGAGTAANLSKAGYSVVKHMGGASSSIPEKYRNRRSQIYFVFRDFLRDGRVHFSEAVDNDSDWDDLCAQVLSIRMKPGTERLEEIEPKAQMLMRGVKSPDIGDSLSMQFAAKNANVEDDDSSDTGFFVMSSAVGGYR